MIATAAAISLTPAFAGPDFIRALGLAGKLSAEVRNAGMPPKSCSRDGAIVEDAAYFSDAEDLDALPAGVLFGDPPKGTTRDQEKRKWERAGFGKVRINYFETRQVRREARTFEVTAVLLRNTGWDRLTVLERISRANHVFGQCGIQIARITLVEAEAPEGAVDLEEPGLHLEDSRIAARTPWAKRPTIYYVRRLRWPAYAAPRSVHPGNRALQDTIWMDHWASTMSHSHSSTEAHELGHLFLNSGDHPARFFGSLMGGEGSKLFTSLGIAKANDKFTGEECAFMRASPLIHYRRGTP